MNPWQKIVINMDVVVKYASPKLQRELEDMMIKLMKVKDNKGKALGNLIVPIFEPRD